MKVILKSAKELYPLGWVIEGSDDGSFLWLKKGGHGVAMDSDIVYEPHTVVDYPTIAIELVTAYPELFEEIY